MEVMPAGLASPASHFGYFIFGKIPKYPDKSFSMHRFQISKNILSSDLMQANRKFS
ncbi:Uncharacterized protein dnm_076920 [Desulfonema magnum]|uniref:Uncharacterized protein n=1 Tax=Desulfonema magnum TaxID=45655 RepID=A0A975GS31_9BACT|nr:Uncharacterized protein dnm_076920 [Desulfonema magnum]